MSSPNACKIWICAKCEIYIYMNIHMYMQWCMWCSHECCMQEIAYVRRPRPPARRGAQGRAADGKGGASGKKRLGYWLVLPEQSWTCTPLLNGLKHLDCVSQVGYVSLHGRCKLPFAKKWFLILIPGPNRSPRPQLASRNATKWRTSPIGPSLACCFGVAKVTVWSQPISCRFSKQR